MSPSLLKTLDVAFFVFHTLVIVVNLTGWIWPRTRKLHMIVLGLTAFSWFALGPLLGFPLGYCLCTDWHWQIRRQLGINDSGGYIELLFSMAGLPISTATAAIVAYGAFTGALIATVAVNLAIFLRKRAANRR